MPDKNIKTKHVKGKSALHEGESIHGKEDDEWTERAAKLLVDIRAGKRRANKNYSVEQNTFEGHRGRPGQKGGSLARDASASVHDRAEERHANYVKDEPEVTKEMEELSEETGARLSGLKHRVKPLNSMKRKVIADAKEQNITHAEAVEGITDVLRYTMVYDKPEEFTQDVKDVESSLKSKGYKRYDSKYKNYFGPDSVYEGYNTVWTNPSGRTFELQFHTETSLKIKEVNHKLYQKFRVSDNEAERASLINQMINNWRAPEYIRPAGFEALGLGD